MESPAIDTQSDLGSAIGRSYNQISAWETGDGNLRAPSLTLLAGALGVTVTWLRDGDPVAVPARAPGLHEARLRAVVEAVEGLLADQKRPSPGPGG